MESDVLPEIPTRKKYLNLMQSIYASSNYHFSSILVLQDSKEIKIYCLISLWK